MKPRRHQPMDLARIGAVARLRARELRQALGRVRLDAILDHAHLPGGHPHRIQGEQGTAIRADLLGMGELACLEGREAPGPAADGPAYLNTEAETIPRSINTSIPGWTERESTGVRCCSATRQGANTASTIVWVPPSARYRQRTWGKGRWFLPLLRRAVRTGRWPLYRPPHRACCRWPWAAGRSEGLLCPARC